MNLKALGRCIDQPVILNKLQKKMPVLLIGAGGGYGVLDTYMSTRGKSKEQKKTKAVKNSIIISSTIAASLIGANGLKIAGKQIVPRLLEKSSLTEILENNKKAVDKYIKDS
ncbi:TPA: hypothetical protein CPT85_03130, partial [Candidatus Gastranaerophilales bacterium HUM_21]